MQRNADLKAAGSGEARAPDFLTTHPATPERIKNALANARQFSGPGAGERDRNEYLADLDGLAYGEDPSEGFVRGRRFLHPKLGFTFLAPPGFTLDNTAQAVLGLKGGNEAMRLDVVSVPAEQSLPDYLKSGWMEKVDPSSVEEFTVNGFPAATATAERRAMVVPAVRRALRQRRLSVHFRGEGQDRAGRPLVPRIDCNLPPHEPEGKRAGPPAAPEDRHRRRARYGGDAGAPHGDRRSFARPLPRDQRPRRRTTR